MNGCKDLSKEQRQKVILWKRELCTLLGCSPDSGFIFIFRTGYAKPPSIRSLRKPVEHFMLPPSLRESPKAIRSRLPEIK